MMRVESSVSTRTQKLPRDPSQDLRILKCTSHWKSSLRPMLRMTGSKRGWILVCSRWRHTERDQGVESGVMQDAALVDAGHCFRLMVRRCEGSREWKLLETYLLMGSAVPVRAQNFQGILRESCAFLMYISHWKLRLRPTLRMTGSKGGGVWCVIVEGILSRIKSDLDPGSTNFLCSHLLQRTMVYPIA